MTNKKQDESKQHMNRVRGLKAGFLNRRTRKQMGSAAADQLKKRQAAVQKAAKDFDLPKLYKDAGKPDYNAAEWLKQQRAAARKQKTARAAGETIPTDVPNAEDEILNYYSRTTTIRFEYDKDRTEQSLTQILDEMDQMTDRSSLTKTLRDDRLDLVQYDFGHRQRQQMKQDLDLRHATKRSRVVQTLSAFQSIVSVKKGGHNTAYAKIRRGVKEFRRTGDSSSIQFMVGQMYDMGLTKEKIREIMGITFNKTRTPRYIGSSSALKKRAEAQYAITSVLSTGNKTAKEQSFRLTDLYVFARQRMRGVEVIVDSRKQKITLSRSIRQSRALAGNLELGILNKVGKLSKHATKRGYAMYSDQQQNAEMESYRSYDSVTSETHSSEGSLTFGAIIGIAIAASIAQELLVEKLTSLMASKGAQFVAKRLARHMGKRTIQKVVNHAQSRMGIGVELAVNMTEFLLVAARGKSHVDRYGNAAHGNFSGLSFAMDQMSFPSGTAHGIKYAIDLAEANAEQRSYTVNSGHMARDFSMMMEETRIGHAVEASRRPICRDEQRIMRATAMEAQSDSTKIFRTNMSSYRRFCRSYDLTFLSAGHVDAGARTIKLLVRDFGMVRELELGDRVHVVLPVSGSFDEACFRVSEKTGLYALLRYVEVPAAIAGELLRPDAVTTRLSADENQLSQLSLVVGTMVPVTLVSNAGTPTRLERPHWFGKLMYANDAAGEISVGTTYSMVVDLAPGRVRLSDLLGDVRREMVTELMTAQNNSVGFALMGADESGRMRFRAGTIQALENFDDMTLDVSNAVRATTFKGVGRSDYAIRQGSGDATRVHLRRDRTDRMRVYRSGSDRARLLVAPPVGLRSDACSFSVATRPLAPRVAWSSPRMYSDFDVYRATDVVETSTNGEYRLTVDRPLPEHLVGSTVHVGDTSDATLVRWASGSELVVRLPTHEPLTRITTRLQRNATAPDADVTTLLVTDVTGIATDYVIEQPFQANIVSVSAADRTIVLDRMLDAAPDSQAELVLKRVSLVPAWRVYRGPRNAVATLTLGMFTLRLAVASPLYAHTSLLTPTFRDSVFVEACGDDELRLRVAPDVGVTGEGWELEVPALDLNQCVMVPTLRMRGAPPGELLRGDVVRFPGEKVARRVLQVGDAVPSTAGDVSRTVVSQSSVDRTMRSLTLSEAVPASVAAHTWRVVLPAVEQCTFPVYSVDEARTTVVVGDLHGMWPRATSSVVFYAATTTTGSARETVLSNARLPDGFALERLPESESHAYPQAVEGTTSSRSRSLARATMGGWSGGSGLAARCAWHVDMGSFQAATEVTAPTMTRLLLRNARLKGGIGVQPLALRRGGELRAYGAALLDAGSPQTRGLCSRAPLRVLSAGPRLEDPHMSPTRFPPPTTVRCVGPTIWRLEWNTGFTVSASAGEVVFLMPANVYKAMPIFEGIVRTTVRQSSHVDVVPRVSPVREDQVGQDPVRVDLHAIRNRFDPFQTNTYENKDSGFTFRRFVRPRPAGAKSEMSGWIMRRTRPPALRVWRNLLSGVETRMDKRTGRMEHRAVPPVTCGVRLTQGFERDGNRFDIVFPGPVEKSGTVEGVFFLGTGDAEQRLLTSRGSGSFLTPAGGVSDSSFFFHGTKLQSHGNGTYSYPSPAAYGGLTASSVTIDGNTVSVTFDWLSSDSASSVRFIEYVPTCKVHLRTALRRITHFRIGARQTRDARVLHADPELTRALHTSDFTGRDASRTRTNRALYPNLRIDDRRLASTL